MCPFCQTPSPKPSSAPREGLEAHCAQCTWRCAPCSQYCTTFIEYKNNELELVEINILLNDITYYFQMVFKTEITRLISRRPLEGYGDFMPPATTEVIMAVSQILPITPFNAKEKLKTYLLFS